MSKINKNEEKSLDIINNKNTINLHLDNSKEGLKSFKIFHLKDLDKKRNILNKDIFHLIKDKINNNLPSEEKDNKSNNEKSVLPLINISNILKEISSSYFLLDEKKENKNDSTIISNYKIKEESFTEIKNKIDRNNHRTIFTCNSNKPNLNLKQIKNIEKLNNQSSTTINNKIANNSEERKNDFFEKHLGVKDKSFSQRKIIIRNQPLKNTRPLLIKLNSNPDFKTSHPINNSFIINKELNKNNKKEILNNSNSIKNISKLDEYYFNLKLKDKDKCLKLEKDIINKTKINNSLFNYDRFNKKEYYIKLKRVHSLRKNGLKNTIIKDYKNNSNLNKVDGLRSEEISKNNKNKKKYFFKK